MAEMMQIDGFQSNKAGIRQDLSNRVIKLTSLFNLSYVHAFIET